MSVADVGGSIAAFQNVRQKFLSAARGRNRFPPRGAMRTSRGFATGGVHRGPIPTVERQAFLMMLKN
jgi:hypothetical protein